MEMTAQEQFGYLLTRAKSGNADAQLLVAISYLTGNGVLLNERQAFAWCNDAATQGSVRAQLLLGYLLHFGIGIQANQREADVWLWRAAQKEISDNVEVQNAMINYSSMIKIREDLAGTVYRFRSPFGEEVTWRCTTSCSGDGAFKRRFRRVAANSLFS